MNKLYDKVSNIEAKIKSKNTEISNLRMKKRKLLAYQIEEALPSFPGRVKRALRTDMNITLMYELDEFLYKKELFIENNHHEYFQAYSNRYKKFDDPKSRLLSLHFVGEDSASHALKVYESYINNNKRDVIKLRQEIEKLVQEIENLKKEKKLINPQISDAIPELQTRVKTALKMIEVITVLDLYEFLNGKLPPKNDRLSTNFLAKYSKADTPIKRLVCLYNIGEDTAKDSVEIFKKYKEKIYNL